MMVYFAGKVCIVLFRRLEYNLCFSLAKVASPFFRRKRPFAAAHPRAIAKLVRGQVDLSEAALADEPAEPVVADVFQIRRREFTANARSVHGFAVLCNAGGKCLRAGARGWRRGLLEELFVGVGKLLSPLASAPRSMRNLLLILPSPSWLTNVADGCPFLAMTWACMHASPIHRPGHGSPSRPRTYLFSLGLLFSLSPEI